MRTIFFLLGLGMLTGMAPLPAASVEEDIVKDSVVVVPLEGEVSEAQFYFLRRVLKKADREGVSALILNMDTYGGALKTTDHIVQALGKVSYPTFTYVNANAGSAGALIAIGTSAIYMAPVSAIGASAPVMSGGGEMSETMDAKTVSYFSGYFRSVAQLNGYNPNLVDAFMNLKKEVKVGDRVLNPEGALLTLSAQEAVEVIDGKPLLASGIVASLPELCEAAGLDPGNIVEVEPSGFEQLAKWITALAPLFMLGGIMGAYMEFKSPGFGVAGVLSAFCFLLYFTGHYIAGLTGFEVGVVFLLGVLLVMVEVIFFPGLFLPAAIGVSLMAGSLFVAMIDRYPGESWAVDPNLLMAPLINFGITLVLAVTGIVLLARFLPQIPFFNRLILATAAPTGASLTDSETFPPETPMGVGEEGMAYTTLRPSGKVEFGRVLVDVITDGEFIEAGTAVKICAIEDGQVVVTPLATK